MADRWTVGVAEVSVDGSALTPLVAEALIDARVEQSVHVPDRFWLRFRDPTFDLVDADTFSIGAELDVSVSTGDVEANVVRGEITAMTVEQGPGGRHELVVSGLDRGHRLARGPVYRTFAGMTDADIARQIGRERGLTVDADGEGIKHDYLLQRGTDHAFLTERARAIGFDWWVSGDTLHFKKNARMESGPTVWFGEDLLRFKVRASFVEAAAEVVVRGWDPDGQEPIVGTASMGSGGNGVALGTTAPLADEAISGASKFASSIRRGTGSIGVLNTSEADALAEAMVSSATAEYVSARGETRGIPTLRAGMEIEIKGVGRKLSGRYVLTSVEHLLAAGQRYVTRFVSGGRSPDTLVDLLSGGAGSAPMWGERGVVIGIVTNNKDPEGMGRVKVRFPTLSDKDESWWARVAAIGAGPTRGLSVMFEVNDEVLVAFEHGDVRKAIVLGGLWSKKHLPYEGGGETDDEGVASRVWRSRTGHTVQLHDSATPAQSFVAIALADGKTKLRLGADNVTLESPTDISITSDQGITIKSTGDLALEGANITMKATSAASVEATNVTAKGKGSLKLEGAQAELKGTAQVSVEGGAIAAIKGGIVKLN